MRKIDAISKIDSKLLKHLIFNSDGLVYAQDISVNQPITKILTSFCLRASSYDG